MVNAAATRIPTGSFSQSAGPAKRATDAPTAAPAESFTPSTFDPKEFRGVLGQFGTGVAVITTEDEQGDKAGMTVSSFTSVSLDPPLVLFCAKEGSKTMAEVQENGHFAVNFLRDDQKDLCYQFAGKSEGDKFKDVAFQEGRAFGDPLLNGSIANLECKLHTMYPGGDHMIVIGQVVGMSRTPEHDLPLLFWDGKAEYPKAQ